MCIAASIRKFASAAFGAILLLTAHTARTEFLLTEHFDGIVPDQSPIGLTPGWHAWALHAGAVADYSHSAPGPAYPSLSYAKLGAGTGGIGYLVMGAGNVVSNTLVWIDCAISLHTRTNLILSFYSNSEAAGSRQRVIVRLGSNWYASAAALQTSVGTWGLHRLEMLPATGEVSWHSFNTNTLTLGDPVTGPLPSGMLTAIGFFGIFRGDASKIRIDEVQVGTASEMRDSSNSPLAAHRNPAMDPDYLVGSWIWTEQTTRQQTCRFWKLIEIPPATVVWRARVRMTADNSYRAFIDGMEFGRAAYWQRLAEYDLASVLTPGAHVLAVEVFNDEGSAGLVAGISAELENGGLIEIPSDRTWRIVPQQERAWTTRKKPSADWPFATASFPFRERPALQTPVQVFPWPPFQPPVSRLWQQRWFQTALISFCGLVVLLCLRLLAKLALHSKARQVLQRERSRIARDIHDDFGAALTQLVLLGETAQAEPATSPESRASFARVSDTGRRLLRSIDEVVWLVNSQRDSLRDFETYVCRYSENFLRASSIRCRIDTDTDIPDAAFDLPARRSFFLVIKETLTNIVRHSAASEVQLSMHVENDRVRVTLQDNGKGFLPAERDLSRNGLTNMTQRMKEIGGTCRVTSQPNAGCTVELTAPISRAKSRPWSTPNRQPSSPGLDKKIAP